MGILSLEARTGAHASRIIQTTPIHVAVVDLALPLDDADDVTPELSEGGSRILELLARLESPPPVVAVKRSRTHRDDTRDISSALRLGAFAIIDRPSGLSDLNLILDILRRCLERHHRGCWPRNPDPES